MREGKWMKNEFVQNHSFSSLFDNLLICDAALTHQNSVSMDCDLPTTAKLFISLFPVPKYFQRFPSIKVVVLCVVLPKPEKTRRREAGGEGGNEKQLHRTPDKTIIKHSMNELMSNGQQPPTIVFYMHIIFTNRTSQVLNPVNLTHTQAIIIIICWFSHKNEKCAH